MTAVLDARVLVAHLDGRHADHDRAERVLHDLARSPLAASVLTLAEVLGRPAQVGRLEDAEVALRRLGVRAVPVGESAPARLARLGAQTGLRLPDLCVLLAAQDTGAAQVVTFDARLAEQGGLLGILTHG